MGGDGQYVHEAGLTSQQEAAPEHHHPAHKEHDQTRPYDHEDRGDDPSGGPFHHRHPLLDLLQLFLGDVRVGTQQLALCVLYQGVGSLGGDDVEQEHDQERTQPGGALPERLEDPDRVGEDIDQTFHEPPCPLLVRLRGGLIAHPGSRRVLVPIAHLLSPAL